MDEVTKNRLIAIFDDIYKTSLEVNTVSAQADIEYLLSRIESFAKKGKHLVEIN